MFKAWQECTFSRNYTRAVAQLILANHRMHTWSLPTANCQIWRIDKFGSQICRLTANFVELTNLAAKFAGWMPILGNRQIWQLTANFGESTNLAAKFARRLPILGNRQIWQSVVIANIGDETNPNPNQRQDAPQAWYSQAWHFSKPDRKSAKKKKPKAD